MTQQALYRALIALTGVMGAAGVALAAAAAHQPDAARLASASSMLLFHAPMAVGALLLVERRLIAINIGLAAACGAVAGAALFAGDLVLWQFFDHALFFMAAPTGGALMIAGWLLLALAAVWPQRP